MRNKLFLKINSIDYRTSESFPTVALCFGFKPEFNPKDVLITRNIDNWKEHQTLEIMNSTFRNSTYNLKVFTFIKFNNVCFLKCLKLLNHVWELLRLAFSNKIILETKNMIFCLKTDKNMTDITSSLFKNLEYHNTEMAYFSLIYKVFF